MNIETQFAFVTLLGHILIVVGILGYLLSSKIRNRIKVFSNNFGYLVSFFIALFSMLISLYFSDVVGWEPCVLCWYQRIAMYPLVVVFAIGVWKQEKGARIYGLSLAGIGFLIAAYQIYLQILSSSGHGLSGFCSTVGAVDCSEIYMLEFGYITFPVMAATAFLAIILIQLVKPRDIIDP